MTRNTFAHVVDFVGLADEYGRIASELSSLLSPAHWDSGESRHYGWGDEMTSRRRLGAIPATDNREVWERSQDLRSSPVVDVDEFVPYLIEAIESPEEVTLWHERRSSLVVSVEQVLVACLLTRLRPLTYNWALHQREDGDPEQLLRDARDQQIELLGAVKESWRGPLGRLSCTGDPFDEIDSFDALTAAHASMVARVANEVEGLAGFDRADLEADLAHRWIDVGRSTDLSGALQEGGIGLNAFDHHAWVFPASWIDQGRGTDFGQHLTAGQLLFAMVGPLRQLEKELGLEADQLVAVACPGWVGLTAAPKRRLPLS